MKRTRQGPRPAARSLKHVARGRGAHVDRDGASGGVAMRSRTLRWTVGRRLALGFGTVTAIFVVALGVALTLSASAGTQWRSATHWDAAVAGANDQLRGTQQQMAAQALYVATGAPRYKSEWEQGVAISNRGAAAVGALHDPTIARIATTANAADHQHDAAVHTRLFPAVASGDHVAALAALRQADRFVRVPLGAQRRLAASTATPPPPPPPPPAPPPPPPPRGRPRATPAASACWPVSSVSCSPPGSRW